MVSWACLRDGRGSRANVLGGKVGSTGATAENDVHILVAAGFDNCCEALLCHTHESVRV